ncbi:MAG: cation:proton antiporter [Candidatus Kapabacteria bacterium]|nr:cation:proton antiporter [Candidatus Kapabacteria bacterium]
MSEILLIGGLDLSLPLKNPVLIFALILFIILFAPILLNKFKIPHLIGLIIAGAVIGPNGLNLMLRDSSIVLFGTVGLLYIMFLAGLEIDLADFKKNSGRSIVFGLYTFIIPITVGSVGAHYLLGFTWITSILLGSMFSSHTLIAYPLISKLGVAKNRAVSVAIGGTMITDTLALLVLAAIAGIATGEIGDEFWFKLSVSVLLFGLFVVIVFPIVGRWFFKKYSDNISQYIFVLGMVFLAAFLSEVAGIEAIIGAFLAGLALNRLIPLTSPLMNRIQFVGNALFIPFFLIGVGMIVDFRAFFKDFDTIIVAIFMIVTATITKFSAAWLTQKTFKFTVDERRLIFGLSNAQAAATLAAVLIGYNIILGQTATGEPIRLLGDSVLNGTILMILITCTIASFSAQKGASNIAVEEAASFTGEGESIEENILIPINNLITVEELINLSITIKSKNNKNELFVLNVITESSPNEGSAKHAEKILEKAAVTASATDNYLHKLQRYELNVAQSISDVVSEYNITDIVLGIHHQSNLSDNFLGKMTKGVLSKSRATTLIYKAQQPLETLKRHLIVIPEKAEKEIGFPFWLIKVWNIARNTGDKLVFYCCEDTLEFIREIHRNHPVDASFNIFNDWKNFLSLINELREDDNLIIVMSRKHNVSYNSNMTDIPAYLNNEFSTNSFILIYPLQLSVNDENTDYLNPSIFEPMRGNLEKLDDIGKTISKLFVKK